MVVNILLAKVSYVRTYNNFEKMLSGGELKYLLPDVYSAEEAISIYESFGSYKSDQFIYGVVSIGFKLKG
jgi:ASC-1-like (ASCH) protein